MVMRSLERPPSLSESLLACCLLQRKPAQLRDRREGKRGCPHPAPSFLPDFPGVVCKASRGTWLLPAAPPSPSASGQAGQDPPLWRLDWRMTTRWLFRCTEPGRWVAGSEAVAWGRGWAGGWKLEVARVPFLPSCPQASRRLPHWQLQSWLRWLRLPRAACGEWWRTPPKRGCVPAPPGQGA